MNMSASIPTTPLVPPGADLPVELVRGFQSHAQWREFHRANRFISNPAYVAGLANTIQQNGFHCPFLQRHVAPGEFRVEGSNHREGIQYGGLNSRMRAVWMQLLLAAEGRRPEELRIYAPEAVTPLALLLRGRYARFIGSEFSEDQCVIDNLFPIRFENLLELSFTHGIFDVVIVNDVFEHVPDIDRCLSELARVTRPGGHLISTFPFTWKADSNVKARLQPEGIEYLTEPEYHDNPVDPKGSLVFEIPGWNILDRARAAGWTQVEMVYHSSVSCGILGSRVAGIIMLVAKR